ncbi:PREDICTED: uncharacterized protein LOC109462808 [Branchiostoma belcheri]|uniref:Uncharacterized protein LOC109462808 n=1 Tax=Branchiostoma belcheri TaxID=7741 RepID=A0A6P4Y858_BRABE|nr:PREDICTED: uncharacterized protein LOC109462808 [Branchiostoma belcheri]
MEFFTVVAVIAVLTAVSVYFLLTRLTTPSSSWPKTKQSQAYTRKVTPKKKKFQTSVNSLNDFAPEGAASAVRDVAGFFSRHGNQFSVYSIDWEQEMVVLVRPVDGADMKTHPFFREAQRRQAAEVLCVPLEELQDVASAVADEVAHVQEIFIFMTARCGSTLVTRLVEATSVAQAVSEPEVFTAISMTVHRLKLSSQRGQTPPHRGCPAVLSSEESTVALLRNIGILLNYNLVTSDPRHRDVIFYKFKPGVILLAELMARAFPSAKTVFMYRNGLEVTESVKRIYFKQSYVLYATLRFAVRAGLLRRAFGSHDFMRCFGEDPKFSTVRYRSTGLFNLYTWWAGAMQRAANLQKKRPEYFFHAIIYYSALVHDKKKTFRLLMEKLGLTWSPDGPGQDTDKIEKVLTEDSQAGTVLSSRNSKRRLGEKWSPDVSPRWVGQWEREYMEEVCRHAGNEVSGPDFLLPDTVV